ncbi:MAG: hotdog domain-containing protein [Promethearchaeota archaeon]
MNIQENTHLKINKHLCGEPIKLAEGYSQVKLQTTLDMILDETRLIHGGFTFSLADYAAMLAINHPNVVLGSSNVRFLKPVVEGDLLIAEAQLREIKGKKHIVDVKVKKENEIVFEGEFICFIPKTHLLKNKGG